MPSTLELCEKYFGTRDIYKLMDLTKDSLEKDIKKAYYKLSLQVHPDRVGDSDKEEATEKFKILTKLNEILTNADKKALYDEQGIIDDDGDANLSNSSWLNMWRQFFGPITTEDIESFERGYIGSPTEERDIRKAYLGGKGCLNYMFNSVPFMGVSDEPRIIELVKRWIAAGEVPEYKQFTEEPRAKRYRRHKKYGQEAAEAAEMRKRMQYKKPTANAANGDSLQQQIAKRNAERAGSANNFFDHLLQKYGGADDSEEYVPPKNKRAKQTKKPTANGKAKAKAKAKAKPIKKGRVTKKK